MMMKLFYITGILGIAVSCPAQFLAETMATTGVADTLSSTQAGSAVMPAAVAPLPAAPGAVGGLPPVGGGFTPGAPGALPPPIPAPGPAGTFPGAPGFPVQPGIPGQPGQPGQPVATPTPVPTEQVVVGRRVYDAVTNALIEDGHKITIVSSERDKYFDDGIRDNGIADDGLRGNVNTVRNEYIGAESFGVLNRLINLIRNAESLEPMKFFGLHIAAVDPTTQHPQMPNYLQKEAQLDDLLRDWNDKFLADFRLKKEDPRSDFYQLYVPMPPLVPANYPLPPGYKSPQATKQDTLITTINTGGQVGQQGRGGLNPTGTQAQDLGEPGI